MKASELRIGNWVKGDTGKPFQFELSDFVDWWNDHNSHEFADHIHPIPLTKKSLLELGFEKTLEYGRNVFRKNNIVVLGGDIFYYQHRRLFFVHQLQNLYYALTGKEL
jgi:hypothetical protein